VSSAALVYGGRIVRLFVVSPELLQLASALSFSIDPGPAAIYELRSYQATARFSKFQSCTFGALFDIESSRRVESG